MAFVTYPLNNIEYYAEDAELFHVTRRSGISSHLDFPITVTGNSNVVTIGEGVAWIHNTKYSGKVTASKTSTELSMPMPDAYNDRVDAIAIRFNAQQNITTLEVVEGTPSLWATPPVPTRTSTIYELFLYTVLRPAGVAEVSASNVTDVRLNADVCGIMADSVTSVDTTAIQSQVESLIADLQSEIESVKSQEGVMLTSTYDSNGDGVVDNAEALGGESSSYYADAVTANKAKETSDAIMLDASRPYFGAKQTQIAGIRGCFSGYIYSNGTKLNMSVPLWKVIPADDKRMGFTLSGTMQVYGANGQLFTGDINDLGTRELSNSWNNLLVTFTLATPLASSNRTSVTCYSNLTIGITLKDSAVWGD